MIALLALACLVSAAALDYALVRHQLAVRSRARVRAGLWSIGCYAASIASTLIIVETTWWMALPTAAGFFLGSMLAVEPDEGS